MIHRKSHNFIKYFLSVITLILNIMDSKYIFYVFISLLIFIENFIIHGYHCSLPVISVNNVRLKVNIPEHFQNRPTVKYKTLTVVKKSVNTVSSKIILIIQKIISHAIANSCKNSAVLFSPRNVYSHMCYKSHRRSEMRINSLIQRKNDPTVMPFLSNSSRQRSGNICQSSGSYIWSCLACRKQYIQNFLHPFNSSDFSIFAYIKRI